MKQKEEDFLTHTLPSGLRLVYKHTTSPVSHLGILIGAGSRHELSDECGLAHLIEHCLFKGTAKRNATQILRRMEEVGADVNAYTSKEETMVHASFLSRYTDRALELFSDLLFASSFPEKETENEKKVVIEEIRSVKDTPHELIFDEFESLLFPEDPMGRPILGDIKSISRFNSRHLQQFVDRHYRAENMVISFVSRMPFQDFIKKTGKYFPGIKNLGATTETSNFKPSRHPVYVAVPAQPFQKRIPKKTYQAHCVLGSIAYSYNDDKRYAMALLNNILGGPAMSSLLNLKLRERLGRVYTIESHYNAFYDTGSFYIYFGTDTRQLDNSISLIRKILSDIAERPFSKTMLQKAKNQYLGQLAISFDSNYGQMLSMGKSFYAFGKIESFDEISQKIKSIEIQDFIDISKEVFSPDRLCELSYLSK